MVMWLRKFHFCIKCPVKTNEFIKNHGNEMILTKWTAVVSIDKNIV